MPSETVLIGCRLPHGLIMRSPADKNVSVTLAGVHSSKILGASHVVTTVDAEFWTAWKKAYSDFAPLRSGAIFEARTEDQIKFKAKELLKEKTGFEPMQQDEAGIKPATTKD